MEKDLPTVINAEDKIETPIEELLGSVTTYNCSEGSECKSQQVRTSARVFKKLKLDSVTATPPLPLERKESTLKEEKLETNKKPLRPSWSPEDKSLFFEALNYYGKDFEAIHLYISNKLKKKGIPDSALKTKDQIRHFYYRTWHKISKHLKFSDGIKKIAQELYGLINYGELRRKVGSVSEKIRMKLNELMYRGNVAIRCRGKTVRVKTPLCRALRRLNQLDEKQEEPKLPTRILVEVTPKDGNSWMQVQLIAQNPRIKALLPLQKRLSSLLEYLNVRWRSSISSAYEKLIDSTNNIVDEPTNTATEADKNLFQPSLRLYPPQTDDLHMPTINLGEYLTSHSICLSAYEERLGIRSSDYQPWSLKGSLKNRGAKRCRNEITAEKTVKANSIIANTDVNATDAALLTDVRNVIDEAINTMLALQNQSITTKKDDKETEEIKMDVDDDKCTNKGDVKNLEESYDNEKKSLVNPKLGWTVDDCGTLTIGELYLMYGSNCKLLLEYGWDSDTKKESIKDDNNSELNEVNRCTDNTSVNNSKDTSGGSVSSTLQKLLSVAKLHFGKNIYKCPCGHSCNYVNNDKVNAPKNKAVIPKHLKNIQSDQKVNGELETNISTGEGFSSNSIDRSSSQMQTNVFKHPRTYGIESITGAHLDHLRPKYINRKNRRSNKLVVERRLPLLANKNSIHQIVQMNIIPQEVNFKSSTTKTTTPRQMENLVPTDNANNATDNDSTSNNNNPLKINNTSFKIIDQNISENRKQELRQTLSCKKDSDMPLTTADERIKDNKEMNPSEINDNATTSSRVNSPGSICGLLEFSDRNAAIPSFVGLLPNSTPPASPSRILKEIENQWITAEVADFSLSSFLGHLESPAKPDRVSPSPQVADDSRLSQDVDAHLQSLFSENSVDYMAKFADLAAQVTSEKK
ncbi:protein cramped [Agrilus planipennis]|uniref:Protein cramped n=1 Tax=Agrilus planipennis TaxID=224129 RepID=A0A1W4X3S8_AGRPL|nr:protein cramped [Agrilus planipennis]XP_018327453.1 protein cramped [Agrilus planipennis]